ncbi:Long-chain-fatty-acid--CoA ligase 2 [Diplonema papillatum]|nr:Long-chain-fatty-acid--CoA ligase 2 [Diplonema papillatum]
MSVPLQAAATILQGLDYLAWIATLGPLYQASKKVTAPGTRAKQTGEEDCNNDLPPSPIFRSVTPTDGSHAAETLYALIILAHTKYADKKALGTRALLGTEVEKGQRFPTRHFGLTSWMTFEDVGKMAHEFGSGLKELGLRPVHLKADETFNSITGPHSILLYEETCAEWLIAAQGAISQSVVVATWYATLGATSIVAAVNEGKTTTIVCNQKSVGPLLELKDKMPSLKNVIYTTYGKLPGDVSQPPRHADVNVYLFSEVVEMGAKAGHGPDPPTADDVAILMYTSGSSGKPKGVTMRHKHLLSVIRSIDDRIRFVDGDGICGYLPMAHVLELMLEFWIFGHGGTIGFGDPKSLTAGPGKCKPHGALQEFAPTILAGVPKVWEMVKAGAEAKVRAGGASKEYLFNVAMEWKKTAMPHYRWTPVFDALVFAKLKAIVGGKLRLAVSGGGAIAEDVQSWVRTALGCPLIQGYGLTETCAGLTIQSPDEWRTGVVGHPIDSVEVLVHSEPDVTDARRKPYLATDKEHLCSPCLGRGEIWVRGTNVTDGYYAMPKETAEAFDSKGWFHTGDIGVILPDGTIKVVDRKKNIVKLKGGEYVALETMNQAFSTSPLVDKEKGGVCSYGDSTLDKPVALVQVHVENMIALAKSLGITSTDPEVLVRDPTVRAEVTKHLNEVGRRANPPLTSLETLAGVALLLKPWTPADGTLTASLKLVPNRIQVEYAAELEEVTPKGRR